MTAADIITEIDVLEPNQYDMQQKLRWLSDLDGQIYDEVIRRHFPEFPETMRRRPLFYGNPLDQEHIGPFEMTEMPEPPEPDEDPEEDGTEERPPRKRHGRHWPYVLGTETLLVQDPYARDVYTPYLKAMIAKENAEYVKYNAQMTLYNSAYKKWASWYYRNHEPIPPHGGNRWRY